MEAIDFSSARVTTPATITFPFGPGVDLDGVGTIVLYDTSSGTSDEFERRLNVDAFYVAPRGEPVLTGEACPIAGSESLPPDEKYPLTLFVLEGTENQFVYACTGNTIVGLAEFIYVADIADLPSPPPTIKTPVRCLRVIPFMTEHSAL